MRVPRVGDAVPVRVDAPAEPGRGHELHPADRAGRARAHVAPEVRLDLVDRARAPATGSRRRRRRAARASAARRARRAAAGRGRRRQAGGDDDRARRRSACRRSGTPAGEAVARRGRCPSRRAARRDATRTSEPLHELAAGDPQDAALMGCSGGADRRRRRDSDGVPCHRRRGAASRPRRPRASGLDGLLERDEEVVPVRRRRSPRSPGRPRRRDDELISACGEGLHVEEVALGDRVAGSRRPCPRGSGRRCARSLTITSNAATRPPPSAAGGAG